MRIEKIEYMYMLQYEKIFNSIDIRHVNGYDMNMP